MPWWRRPLAVALILGFLFSAVRSAAVVQVTSETFDAQHHLLRGLMEWTNERRGSTLTFFMTDPPLGKMLVSMPIWLTGGSVHSNPTPDRPKTYGVENPPQILWAQDVHSETLRHLISLWKCVLMLPGLAAAFLWARQLYGPVAGWLAWGLLLFEPTLTALTPLATLDAHGFSFSIAAAYLIFRYIEQPAGWRMVIACVATAAALLTKHTSLMLPPFALATALIIWGHRAWIGEGHNPDTPRGTRFVEAFGRGVLRVGGAALLTLIMMWPLTKFDISPPAQAVVRGPSILWWETDAPQWAESYWPLGNYIGSFLGGRRHDDFGHMGYLLGERHIHGWWYYFPVLATYKIPIGHAAVIGLGLISLLWRWPRVRELPLFAGIVLWWGLLLSTNVNIGWRHAMIAVGLTLIASTRCTELLPETAAGWRRALTKVTTVLALLAAVGSAVNVMLWHPNYIPFVNWPREKVWLDISDSNMDWGQSIKQAGTWIDEHRDELAKPIYFFPFGAAIASRNYVSGVENFPKGPGIPMPTHGTLVISPVRVAAHYDSDWSWAEPLRQAEPITTFAGGSMLVYDLSKLSASAPATQPGSPQ